MWDLVSDGEIRRSLSEMSLEVPRINRHLSDARQGKMSLRDAVYFSLLEAMESRRRIERRNNEVATSSR